jgi:uncharacterized membrane protein YdcZ (DUF606 family)
MAGTTDLVFIILSIIAGAALALQAPLNAALGKAFSSSFSAVISFALGLAVLFVYFVIDTRGFQRGSYSTKNVPWWAWLGGACGGFYVLIVVIAIPKYVCRTAHAVMCVHACACILRCVTLQWRTCEAMFNAIVLSHNVCTI